MQVASLRYNRTEFVAPDTSRPHHSLPLMYMASLTLCQLYQRFLIDKVGRRPLLMCGAFGTFVSLAVGGIIGGYGSSLASYKAAGWASIALIYIYDISFSYSFAPIRWVLPSETFNLLLYGILLSPRTPTCG
jgi:hypothetical protein